MSGLGANSADSWANCEVPLRGFGASSGHQLMLSTMSLLMSYAI
jgi:hypothetical protein